MGEFAIVTAAATLVGEEEGACFGTIAGGGGGELVSLWHGGGDLSIDDGLVEARTIIWMMLLK